ncbi:DUF3341 domain-containing protein [bacterium]|nr:MAG: DUF3341 domain-containing protein [bacterium]
MSNSMIGLFQHVDVLLDAADRCKKAGFTVEIISPVPLNHEIDHAFGERPNRVRYFTSFGAICGFFFGWFVAFVTAAIYVLPRSGRPILPFTPTLLIAYETTILFGVIWSLIGFFVLSRLPAIKKRPFHPRIAIDAFGLVVNGIREDRFPDAENILKQFGASEVKKVEECCC